ncbi:reticulocyte-binding protein homolog 1 [Eurosta solidaginis]|uniref:reticulocyte-binding protein homolog 1 n=1 Tax=Eurosta solidaginis TaxID=178769 RepID=UPI00353114AF
MDNSSDENNTVYKLKVGVHKKFAELRAALQMREKLLLRQLEVVASTQQRITECGAENNIPASSNMNENDIQILFENEDDLLGAIRTFGRFQLGSMLLALKQEDYISPRCDHETMYKNIQSDDNQFDLLPCHTNVSEAIVVDFSKDKSLIEDNTKYINNSIVNITLGEAKELIRKARIKNETSIPPLNLEELYDELDSSIAEAVSNLNRDSNSNDQKMHYIQEKGTFKKSRIGRSKQKITINNCSGTLNLRNISSVTINCGKCEHDDLKIHSNLSNSKNSTTTNLDAIVPCVVDGASEYSTPTSAESLSNQSSNSSSRSQSKKQRKVIMNVEQPNELNKNEQGGFICTNPNIPNIQSNADSTETDPYSREITCDFYNRLLNEIKRNLEEQKSSQDITRYKKSYKVTSKQIQGIEPHLVFKNLNIVLKNDSQDENIHPVHIEHWLSEIIKDTNLEPMQNTDILEHSNINE